MVILVQRAGLVYVSSPDELFVNAQWRCLQFFKKFPTLKGKLLSFQENNLTREGNVKFLRNRLRACKKPDGHDQAHQGLGIT